jgi:hypothetical protein
VDNENWWLEEAEAEPTAADNIDNIDEGDKNKPAAAMEAVDAADRLQHSFRNINDRNNESEKCQHHCVDGG